MNAEIPNKDSYDQSLHFSRITVENWLLPDRKNYMPLGVPEEQWAAPFLKAQLETTVPLDVIRVFEMARGCMIYSWFFYPLATLGLEQCTRVVEFAVWERCRMLQKARNNFSVNLKTLIAAGLISAPEEIRWQSVRWLRNDRSHLKDFMLMDPGECIRFLTTTAKLINALFATSSKSST